MIIGVFGSADALPEQIQKIAYQLGESLAKRNITALTGACGGVSAAVVAGCKNNNGLTIGVSPARNKDEHINKNNLPTQDLDIIIYTGSGYKGRNIVAVQSSDICIFVRGGVGTLNELTIAIDEGKIIGLLQETGGTADMASNFIRDFTNQNLIRGSNFRVYANSKVDSLLEEITKAFTGGT